MTTIDERGRAAASELRRSMDHGFDVEAGLASVLREETVVNLATAAARPRRTWMLLSVAAAVIAIAMVGVWVLREPDEVDVGEVPSTEASEAPVPTTEVPATTALVDVVETTVEPPSTTTSAPVEVVDRTVQVADVVQIVEPRRTVLVSGTIGAGPGELGIEDCQECDPARPWAPVTIPFGPRGEVLVGDTANRRWMLFQPDNPDAAMSPWSATAIPWPDGIGVGSQPVVDEAGVVYAVMFGPLGDDGTNTSELWTYDARRNLTDPAGRYPAPSIGNAPIMLTPTMVSVGGQIVDGLVPTVGTVSWTGVILGYADLAAGTPAQLILDPEGSSTTFVYEPGEAVAFYGPNPVLPDGSVLTVQTGPDGEIVDRLFLDGRVARTALPPSASMSGAAATSGGNLVRLEGSIDGDGWEIARYELPFPTLTSRRPVGDRAAAVFDTVTTPDPELYLASVRAMLAAEFGDDCVDPSVGDPTGSWVEVSGGTADALATFEISIPCDDSSVGFRWVAEMRAGGDGWRAVDVTEQTICARGVTSDGGDERCV